VRRIRAGAAEGGRVQEHHDDDAHAHIDDDGADRRTDDHDRGGERAGDPNDDAGETEHHDRGSCCHAAANNGPAG
jgi:hypothetical protein